ncbi:MAG: TonB-dependent receptor [Vicinamibacteria bacterium]|nr:TonB-dependent receptor [Vicinamibacteria bacterium]
MTASTDLDLGGRALTHWRFLRHMAAAWVGLLLVLAWTTPCRAEAGGATVVVRVTDPTGAVAPGATVAAMDEARAGHSLVTARSDSKGIAVLANVPVGWTRLRVSCQDFSTWEKRRLVVAGELIIVHANIDQYGDDVIVLAGRFGGRCFWDVRGRFDNALQTIMPDSGSIWSLLETAEPAAIVDRIDGAGLYLGEPGRFSMRGASWTQNNIVLDGLDITDGLRGGTPLAYPGVDTLDAIDVTSALAPVEYAAPGVTMALTPRAPSREWRGQAQAYWTSSGAQSKPRAGDAPSIARFGSLADTSFLVSGPIHKRLRVLISGRAARVRRFERDRPEELKTQLASFFGHLAYQASERSILRLVTSIQALEKPFSGRARFSDSSVAERDHFIGAQLRWERVGERRTWSAFAGFQEGLFRARTEGRVADRPIDRLLDGPVTELVLPGRSRRGAWSAGSSLGLGASRVLGVWHALRFGVTAGGSAAADRPDSSGVTAELVNGLPARVWDYGYAGPVSRRSTFDLGVYAADRLIFRDRLFVEAGARLDATNGAALGAPQGIAWSAISPRVSARLRLADFGRISLLGGYARYRHRLLLDALAFGDPAGAQGSVYLWNDRNGDRLYDAAERGVLVARVGPGSSDGETATIDPRLKPPRTREIVAGVEARPGRGWTFRLTGFDRRETDLIESVNVGAPPSAYDVIYIPDPAGDLLGAQDDQLLPIHARKPESFGMDRYVLTNPADHAAEHQGIELRLEKRFGERLRILAGAMAYRTDASGGNRGFRIFENDHGMIGELYDNPNADTHSLGRGFFDRAYAIKMSMSCRAPGDVTIATVARYHDGQPFARYVVVENLPQGVEAIPAVPRGQIGRSEAMDDQGRYIVPSGHRFTYTLTWDARIEKGLRVGSRRVALSVEAFNLLNTRHEVEEDIVSGAGFRTPTAIQPPRSFRFGLRYAF